MYFLLLCSVNCKYISSNHDYALIMRPFSLTGFSDSFISKVLNIYIIFNDIWDSHTQHANPNSR